MDPKTKGRIYGLCSVLFYGLGLIAVKESKHTSYQLAQVRALINVVIGLAISGYYGTSLFAKTTKGTNFFMFRALFGGGGALVGKYCMKLLSISIFSIFTRISIFMSLILGRIFLGNKINTKIMLLAVVAFLGIILNINPKLLGLGWLDTSVPDPTKQNEVFNGTPKEWTGVLLMVVFIHTMSGTRILITYVSQKFQLTTVQNLFWMHLGLLHWSYIMNFTDPLVFDISELQNYLLIGAAGGMYQYCLSNACRLEPNPAVILIIQNLLIVFGYIMDTILFDRDVTLLNGIGGGLVMASSILALLYKEKNGDDEEETKKIECESGETLKEIENKTKN